MAVREVRYLTKEDLIRDIQSRTMYSKATVANVIFAFLHSIADSLSRGEEVRLRGFGTFEVAERASRAARNPSTNEQIVIPARSVAVFKAGEMLKRAAVNGKDRK
jgi:DNA-binding protein HU-beta